MPRKNVAAKSRNTKKDGQSAEIGGSLLNKSISAISRKPKIFMYTFLLDLGFVGVFLLLNYLVNLLIPADPAFISKVQADSMMFIGVLLLLVVYFLLSVLIYSFFSLIVLGKVKSYSVDHTHDFSMFKNMFLLNLLLFAIFFIIMIIFNLILGLIVNTSIWISVFVSIILFLIAFMAYAFYNFTHSSFILNHELSDSLKHAAKHLFTRSYLGIFMFSIAVLLAYILAYFLTGLLFKDFVLQNYEEFVNLSSVVTIILVYLLFSFNRVYFFFVAERHIGHKE